MLSHLANICHGEFALKAPTAGRVTLSPDSALHISCPRPAPLPRGARGVTHLSVCWECARLPEGSDVPCMLSQPQQSVSASTRNTPVLGCRAGVTLSLGLICESSGVLPARGGLSCVWEGKQGFGRGAGHQSPQNGGNWDAWLARVITGPRGSPQPFTWIGSRTWNLPS